MARLHRLDARQMLDALSLTLTQATCPGEIKYSPDSAMRVVRDVHLPKGLRAASASFSAMSS